MHFNKIDTMKNQIVGWLILAVTLAIPFSKVYFNLSELANWEKAFYFVIMLVGLTVGYVIIGNAKEANKKSHH